MDESDGVRPIRPAVDVPEVEVRHSFWIPKQEVRERVQERASGNLQRVPPVNGNSKRLKAKNPSVIGLPKLQACHYSASCGIRPASQRKTLFFAGQPPRRGSNGRRVVLPEKEPLSPKVSCLGSLNLKAKDRKERKDRMEHPPAALAAGRGFLRRLSAKLCRRKRALNFSDRKPTPVTPRKEDIWESVFAPEEEAAAPASVPPGLGAMKRFAGCRKSASVVGVLDIEDEAAEDAASLASEPPVLGAMKKFASHRKSASAAGVLDFDDDDNDLQIRLTGLRYQMDLHVADRLAGHRPAAML